MKNRHWIIIIILLFAVSLAGTLYFRFGTLRSTVAKVYLDNECIASVDLNLVTEPYEFPVESSYGTNVIRVEQGRICVIDADCKDQICVESGWLTNSVTPIVCLPHRLVIEIDGTADSENSGDTPSLDAVAE